MPRGAVYVHCEGQGGRQRACAGEGARRLPAAPRQGGAGQHARGQAYAPAGSRPMPERIGRPEQSGSPPTHCVARRPWLGQPAVPTTAACDGRLPTTYPSVRGTVRGIEGAAPLSYCFAGRRRRNGPKKQVRAGPAAGSAQPASIVARSPGHAGRNSEPQLGCWLPEFGGLRPGVIISEEDRGQLRRRAGRR